MPRWPTRLPPCATRRVAHRTTDAIPPSQMKRASATASEEVRRATKEHLRSKRAAAPSTALEAAKMKVATMAGFTKNARWEWETAKEAEVEAKAELLAAMEEEAAANIELKAAEAEAA